MPPDFSHLIKSASNGRLKLRLLAVSYYVNGKNRTEIAKMLNVSRLSVNRWVKLYLDLGVDGLVEKPRMGRPPQLTNAQKKVLKKQVTNCLIVPKEGKLQGSDIADYIAKEFNV
ncbi:helix-turn-helix domain containing protein, partial [Vibrio parahaemolyticus]|nr:helix-turn-helix domain containing protein [Vibrio parahaemolyticus]